MATFRYTLGRTATPRSTEGQGNDASSNVNLDWLLGLNKNLADKSPDAQRFREIIGADSIQTSELIKWIQQAQNTDDVLHRRAYQDIIVSLGKKLGFSVEYGWYEHSADAPFYFNGLWNSQNVTLGLCTFYERLETYDMESFKRGWDSFFKSFNIPMEKFTCLFFFANGCARKVEGQLAGWQAAGRVRLLKQKTFLELVSMYENSLIGFDEVERLLGSGRLMYTEELLAYIHRFMSSQPTKAPQAAPVQVAPAAVAPAAAPPPPAPPTPSIAPAEDLFAPEPSFVDDAPSEIAPMVEPEPAPAPPPAPEPIFEPTPAPAPPQPVVPQAPPPAPEPEEAFVIEEGPIEVSAEPVFEPAPPPPAPPAPEPVFEPEPEPVPRPEPVAEPVETFEIEEETISIVEEDDGDSIAAIRGRVAAIGGDDEVVVLDESTDDVNSVQARLAMLDGSEPVAPGPPPAAPAPAPEPAPAPPPQAAPAQPAPEPTTSSAGLAGDIAALEKVVANNPSNLPAQVQLGKLYARSGQFDKAIEAIKKVINEESDHIQGNLVLGEIHFRKQEYPKAALSYDVVLNKDPNNLEALMNLGKVYLAQEKLSRALKTFQRASKATASPNADLELQIAKVYYIQEKLDKALVHLQHAKEIDPANVNVYLALGHYYLDTKNPVEAKRAFEEGLKLDPGNIKLQTYVNNLQ